MTNMEPAAIHIAAIATSPIVFSFVTKIFERSLPRSGSALNSKFFAIPDKNQIGSLGHFFNSAA
jgi:uncharacterized membrane protein YfhO